MSEDEKLQIEIDLENYVNFLKRKSIVSVSDLEKIYDLIFKIQIRFEEIRKSRDNWRSKYKELKDESKRKGN